MQSVIEKFSACGVAILGSEDVLCLAATEHLVVLECANGHTRLVPMCEAHFAGAVDDDQVVWGKCELCESLHGWARTMWFVHREPYSDDHPYLLQLIKDREEIESL